MKDPTAPNPFDRVVCITLDSREERWRRFLDDLPEGWPFGEVEKYRAINGRVCKPPEWWNQGPGAWGCYRSHVRIMEECINSGTHSVLILEDDAICCEDFTERWKKFYDSVPPDWGMLYLGGQHLRARSNPPRRVNDRVFRPYNVNRTHAYALRGDTMLKVYRHVCQTAKWKPRFHIDHHLGLLLQRRQDPIFCPREWLIGQNETHSDISGKNWDEPRFFPPAHDPVLNTPEDTPFVAVLGLHRSGSSCMAGIVHSLGVHMGNKFTGCEADGGYEAQDLARMCEKYMPFPGVSVKLSAREIRSRLNNWIHARQVEAEQQKTVAGGKYPNLCTMGEHLRHVVGDQLYVVNISRPLEESIQSLIKRSGRRHRHESLKKLQRLLMNKKIAFLKTARHVVTVEYDDLLKYTEREVRRIAEFLPIEATEENIQAAIKYVKPEKRRVKLEHEEPATV